MTITIDDFIAGWIGGICGLIVGHPLDTTKVRQQTLGTNMLVAIRRTFEHEGIHGFFKGLLFPILTIGPANAVFFGVYANTINMFQHTSHRNHKISYTDTEAIRRIFSAAMVGGVAQTLCTCPVEVIKTNMQAQTSQDASWEKHYRAPYDGSVAALKGIVKDYGIRGLFRGLVPMLMRDVPTSGIYMLTYEMLLYSTFKQMQASSLVKQMLAGGTAGVASWILVIPLDVVKSRIQADNPKNPVYKGTLDCFYKSYKNGGLRVFFKGATAIVLRTFLVNAAIFASYETAMTRITYWRQR